MKFYVTVVFSLSAAINLQAQKNQQIQYLTSDSSIISIDARLINIVDSGIYVKQYSERLNQYGNTFFISNIKVSLSNTCTSPKS